MLKINDLSLEKAIIHRLDNQNNYPNGIELSELELELSIELKEVIETHTKSGLEDARIRFAKFIDSESNNVKLVCESIFIDAETFVENSIVLAKNLFLSMANKSISAADLVVCLFVSNGKYMIGMLKLDYKDQYISETSMKDGKKYISIKKLEKGWPELGRRLQKASFVIKKDPEIVDENQYDLIVLDRQQSNKDENDISRFFRQNFLNITLLEDENTNTKSFIRGAKKISEEYEAITETKRKEIYESAINLVISSENINVDTFAASHFDIEKPEDNIHIEKLLQFFEQQGVTRKEFKKSDDVAKRYRKQRVIALNGVKLNIDPSIYDDEEHFQWNRYRNDSGELVADVTIKGLKILSME
ncbi:nucleoid-associated protein [Peribacillus frigoritolerans]|uniref:nucleoid-associated protein n=1 Tax=Peribacillus frigoritolerans TaxID=450367 RepID=UPI002E2355E5|nr:nucleoid-associated protein [Peribacillus frigoritolerans]MED4695809.1 nucleoid-associated protein [Peribacillus frigoritolerans]